MDHICITNEATEMVSGERGKAHSGSECWGALVGPKAPQCIMAGMTWNILEGHSHLNYGGFWDVHRQVFVGVCFYSVG